MRRLSPALLLVLLPLSAVAAEGTKGGAPGTNLDLEYLMAPLAGADGKLMGYAYISARLTATSETLLVPVRAKLPFIQDAFVRDINAKNVATGADPEAVDVAGLEARMMADAVRIMGPGKVRLITVCTVNVAELHPTHTPSPEPADAHQTADAHQNPLKSRCEATKPA